MLYELLITELSATAETGALRAAVHPLADVWHVMTVLPKMSMSPVSLAVKRGAKLRSAAWADGDGSTASAVSATNSASAARVKVVLMCAPPGIARAPASWLAPPASMGPGVSDLGR